MLLVISGTNGDSLGEAEDGEVHASLPPKSRWNLGSVTPLEAPVETTQTLEDKRVLLASATLIHVVHVRMPGTAARDRKSVV